MQCAEFEKGHPPGDFSCGENEAILAGHWTAVALPFHVLMSFDLLLHELTVCMIRLGRYIKQYCFVSERLMREFYKFFIYQ